MKSVVMCVVFLVLAQRWDRPAMESSDLAAPMSMQQKTETQSSETSDDLDSVPLTPQSVPATAQPAPATAQPAPESAPRWEYDDDGKPVVRGAEAPSARPKMEEKKPAASPKENNEKKSVNKPQQKRSGRVATFWFLLPRN